MNAQPSNILSPLTIAHMRLYLELITWNWTNYAITCSGRNWFSLSQQPLTSYSSRGGIMWDFPFPHWHVN